MMLRILICLDGSKPIKIQISLLLEHMIISIKSFQRTVFGINTMLCGIFAKDTRLLDTCILLIPTKERYFTCIFCLLWSKVRFITIKIYVIYLTFIGATSYENLHTVNGHLHGSCMWSLVG